jgi:phage N-6-adenine-methyltransferase
MVNKGLFTSLTDEWETPQDLFDKLNKEFKFTLDVCATKENAKCKLFYSKKEDGLKREWRVRCWMNPPYGRVIGEWVKKAYESSQKGALVVALLPARTDTKWFHEYIYNKAEIRFIKGRLKFSGSKNSAPFPSMVVIWRK